MSNLCNQKVATLLEINDAEPSVITACPGSECGEKSMSNQNFQKEATLQEINDAEPSMITECPASEYGEKSMGNLCNQKVATLLEINDDEPSMIMECPASEYGEKSMSNQSFQKEATLQEINDAEPNPVSEGPTSQDREKSVNKRSNQCHICNKVLSNVFKVKDHIEMVHERLKKIPCPQCDATFLIKRTLRSHLLKVHNDLSILSKFSKCTICLKHFVTKYALQKHMTMQHLGVRPFQCTLCDKNYCFSYMLADHVESYHNNIKRYECSICNMKYTTQTGLNYHTQHKHGSSESLFMCHVCSRDFKTKIDLQGHLRSHEINKELCNICGKIVKYMDQHVRLVHGKKQKSDQVESFFCPICEKDIVLKSGLKYHLKVEHGDAKYDRPALYNCTVCGLAAKTIVGLNRHNIATHLNPNMKLKWCQICKKKCKSPEGLKRHNRMLHPEKEVVAADEEISVEHDEQVDDDADDTEQIFQVDADILEAMAHIEDGRAL